MSLACISICDIINDLQIYTLIVRIKRNFFNNNKNLVNTISFQIKINVSIAYILTRWIAGIIKQLVILPPILR